MEIPWPNCPVEHPEREASKIRHTAKHYTDVQKKTQKEKSKTNFQSKKKTRLTKPDIRGKEPQILTRTAADGIETGTMIMKRMVKNVFSVMMMMALAIVCVTSFTSCGGDDDEIGITPVDGGGTETVDIDYDYIIPCTNWRASVDEVRLWMKGSKFEEAPDLSNGVNVIGFRTPDDKYSVVYYFNGNNMGLSMSSVTYRWYNMKDFEAWKDYTEKMYKVTLEKKEETEGDLAYGCNTYVNGRYCAIMGYIDSYFKQFVAIYGTAEK